MTATLTSPDPLLAEQGARWRLTVHARDFTGNANPTATGLAELTDARSRRLETALNTPAKLTFTVDGRSPAASFVHELTTDVVAWRTDPVDGVESPMFRGVVSASEDVVSEQAHSVNFTAFDYFAMVVRRYLTAVAGWSFTQTDQDDLVYQLLTRATTAMSTNGGTMLTPGSVLPLVLALTNPDGTPRAAKSGQLRDRTYTGGSSFGQLITDLAAVINGFDFDVAPYASPDGGADLLRVWYPARGSGRTDTPLVYGSTVAGFTRSANSADGGYANYIRVVGDNGGGEGPQLIGEAWSPDANDIGRIPVGLWQNTDAASDVNQQATLNQKAQGDLAAQSVLVPSYSLTLRPGWYRPGWPALGDTVPLMIDSGRLHVSTTVRVVALNYSIGDDGQEDVELTVGRPALTLSGLFRSIRQDVDALARR
jgi:hypothetical protein